MGYRVFVVVVGIVMLMPVVLAAQDDVTWYFAWRRETGEVVAYTPNGDVNTIFTGDIEWEYGGERLDSQTAVVMLQSSIDGEVSLYKLTPDSALLLTPVFNANDIPGESARPDTFLGRSGSYVLIRVYDQPFPRALLVNVDTGNTDVLESVTPGSCCRFSEDGQILRYISGVENSDNTIFTLQELLLATGEEKVIHNIESTHPYLYFKPDLYGERWLYEQMFDEENTIIKIDSMLFVDGTSQVVAEERYELTLRSQPDGVQLTELVKGRA